MNRARRNSIFVEEATAIEHLGYPDEQFVLRLHAPKIAALAQPGTFAHIRCDDDLLMRRPMSFFRSDPENGSIEFLYKIVGQGLRALAQTRPGDRISLIGPIGHGFSTDETRPIKAMIGGGVGIPPIVFLAEVLQATGQPIDKSVVFMGSEVPFPFEQTDSSTPLPGVPAAVSSSMALLKQLGVKNRLASKEGYAGCYRGHVTELAREWLSALSAEDRPQVEMFACGPEAMLEAAAALADEFDLPCQLCLEEFMACAVGGCAGCTVPVQTDSGLAMKRVCVDGPVFEAKAIYPR